MNPDQEEQDLPAQPALPVILDEAEARISSALERMARPCVTHHYACDCREDAMRVLLNEVLWWHSGPNLAAYNGCDKDPCLWCENAKRLLGEVGSGEQVAHFLAGPNK